MTSRIVHHFAREPARDETQSDIETLEASRDGRSTRPVRPSPGRQHSFRAAGQGLAEYALLLALVAVLAVGATVYLGGRAASALSDVAAGLSGAGPQATMVAPAPGDYSTKKTCTASGYTWIAKKNGVAAHCQ